MTLAEIRTLAECSRGAGNPIVDQLADFAVAVCKVLVAGPFLEAAMLESFHHDDMGADLAKSIRAAVELEMSK